MIITTHLSAQLRKLGLALPPGAQITGQGYLGYHSFLTHEAALDSCSIGSYSGVRTKDVRFLKLGNYCAVADELKFVTAIPRFPSESQL